ncbi:MAG: methyl-accepting chemotaxis protein [bacterium]
MFNAFNESQSQVVLNKELVEEISNSIQGSNQGVSELSKAMNEISHLIDQFSELVQDLNTSSETQEKISSQLSHL